jgi:hypothetical protein
MKSWYDYFDPGVLLAAAGWLVATWFAFHGLWLAKSTDKRRMLVFGAYTLVAVLIAVGYVYSGVQTLRSNRATERNIKTLLALAGLPSANVRQGLDQLISRTLQPREIIPTQEEVLAHEFELIKGDVPKRFAITVLPSATGETFGIVYAIQRAFARNGINVRIDNQTASSLRETGIMFTMSNPSDPPDIALKLRDAFGVAGIRDIRFVGMGSSVASLYDLTIFIGPAPLKQADAPAPPTASPSRRRRRGGGIATRLAAVAGARHQDADHGLRD